MRGVVLPGEFRPLDPPSPESAPSADGPDPDEAYELARDYALEDED